MKITIVGTGYVGLVAGTCLADLGNDVFCMDNDKDKIEALKRCEIPIYEPGLKDILEISVKEKRLHFITDIKEGVKNSEVIYIAVGTPPGENHEADLTNVMAVAREIGQHISGDLVVVNKSTVPVGTARKVKKIIQETMKGSYEVDVVSNPEFLREGSAVKDFMSPDRIIIGTDSPRAQKIMEKIYRSSVRAGNPMMVTDIESAELIKYASNAFLATKISFINEIARLCEKVGADVKKVAVGMGLDKRIGPRFLQAGIGYGGSCFPKDVKALIQSGIQYDSPFSILPAVEKINEEQRQLAIDKLKSVYPDLKGKKIAIWGLAFKPRTDDIREAPSLIVIEHLLESGAEVVAFDPVAQKNTEKIFPGISFGHDPYSILSGCDALIVVTEWNEFRDLDFERVKLLMKSPVIIDCRNIYEKEDMRKQGFTYIDFGRKELKTVDNPKIN
ncbi:UDP-glucose/GDP-mannose dehydrogenase family protein [candidate division KSB1 bacterium]|nr:UDP-glucose/GDP-mannose dehydrogenase family protein [candidate division KSB1 bacterium]